MEYLLQEDGFAILLENGDFLLLERSLPEVDLLLQEDGLAILLENGDYLLLEPLDINLLTQEDGFEILLENGTGSLLWAYAAPSDIILTGALSAQAASLGGLGGIIVQANGDLTSAVALVEGALTIINLGEPWSDDTYWTDGTGWTD